MSGCRFLVRNYSATCVFKQVLCVSIFVSSFHILSRRFVFTWIPNEMNAIARIVQLCDDAVVSLSLFKFSKNRKILDGVHIACAKMGFYANMLVECCVIGKLRYTKKRTLHIMRTIRSADMICIVPLTVLWMPLYHCVWHASLSVHSQYLALTHSFIHFLWVYIDRICDYIVYIRAVVCFFCSTHLFSRRTRIHRISNEW